MYVECSFTFIPQCVVGSDGVPPVKEGAWLFSSPMSSDFLGAKGFFFFFFFLGFVLWQVLSSLTLISIPLKMLLLGFFVIKEEKQIAMLYDPELIKGLWNKRHFLLICHSPRKAWRKVPIISDWWQGNYEQFSINMFLVICQLICMVC